MPLTLRCADCGFDAHGVDPETLAVEVQEHAWHAHGLRLTTDEALRLSTPPQGRTNPDLREDQQ